MDFPSQVGRHYETEMYWDGERFKLYPYYMMPAPGTYKATVKIKERHCDTKVYIPEDQQGVYIINSPKEKFFLNERVDISWLHREPTTTKYANSVYMF